MCSCIYHSGWGMEAVGKTNSWGGEMKKKERKKETFTVVILEAPFLACVYFSLLFSSIVVFSFNTRSMKFSLFYCQYFCAALV